MSAARGLWALLVLGSSVVRAASADVASASPDAPAVEVAWRTTLRAKAGLRLPIVAPKEGEQGLLVELPFFIELHNTPGNDSFVPYEFWRARVALAGGYRFRWHDWRLDALGLLEHESDHPTGPNLAREFTDFGFVALNDAALTGRARRMTRHPTWLQLTARLHFLTCTASTEACGAGLGVVGDRTFEASVEGLQELTLDADGTWSLFAALSGDVLVATPRIVPGRRISARLGGLWRHAGAVWSLSLFGLAGSDVGYGRAKDVLQLGVQLAWSLADD